MIEKSIPIKAVQDALMMAIIRRSIQRASGIPTGRFGAYTVYPSGSHCSADCRNPKRHTYSSDVRHTGFLSHEGLGRAIERMRLQSGPAEIKQTWGVGYKALKIEISRGILR